MPDYLYTPALIQNRMDWIALLFGLLVFFGGIVLMFQHLRQWRAQERAEIGDRKRRFEWHKFRRRTLVGALVAGCGAIITSLAIPPHPIMFATLVTILVLFLVLILVLATMDLMAVGVFQIATVDPERRRLELEEIVRRQKQRKSDESGSAESTTSQNPVDGKPKGS